MSSRYFSISECISSERTITPELRYQLLFCDDSELYRQLIGPQCKTYCPVLFADRPEQKALFEMANDEREETRLRMLAYYQLHRQNFKIETTKILGIIVEVGLQNGVDVLAVFKDGDTSYIMQSGKVVSYNKKQEPITSFIINILFQGMTAIEKMQLVEIEKPAPPCNGFARINLMTSKGRYADEAQMKYLFNDEKYRSILSTASDVLNTIIEKRKNPRR